MKIVNVSGLDSEAPVDFVNAQSVQAVPLVKFLRIEDAVTDLKAVVLVSEIPVEREMSHLPTQKRRVRVILGLFLNRTLAISTKSRMRGH
jgi:hypothetical protein